MVFRQSGDNVKLEGIEVGGHQSKITGYITQGAEGGTLVAVSGNGIPNLLNGEVWDLKLISVGI